MYNVVLSRDAARILEKATPAMRRRIIAALERAQGQAPQWKEAPG